MFSKTKVLPILILIHSFFLFSCSKGNEGFAPAGDQPNLIVGVAISPSAFTLATNNIKNFTATGGTAPYAFSIFSGSGSILSTTGNFTAPGVPGSTVVRVTDSLGQFADAIVSINSALQISPANPSLGINGNQTFTASGGVSPLTYSVASGSGSINSSSGFYAAPATAGSAVVRVIDSLGNTSDANVSIFSALGISPASSNLAVNNTQNFSAAGGTGPYVFSIFSGTGTINSSTGDYTASVSAGTDTIRVTDSLGGTADAAVTINAGLAISPTSQTTLTNSTITFSNSGGASPFVYSVVSGTGSVDPNTGNYTAPSVNGSSVVRVTDAFGNIANANITITSPLSLSPASTVLAVNNTVTFTGVGGTPPYTYAQIAGTGTINSATGDYTAPASSGTATVRVTDSLGATDTSTVTINPALAISPVSQTTLINSTISFSSSGGVSPYSYSVVSGTGSINSATGSFTAPAANGSATVRVTDSLGNVSNALVTITSTLVLSPASTTLAVNNTATFTGSGGTPPLVYAVALGSGTINSSTGVYTAAASAGSATIRVTDSLGATDTSTVTVNAALVISPSSQTMSINGSLNFSASNGVSPYTYSLLSGTGSIDASTGVYTAAATAGSAVVRVTDSLGNTSNSSVTITNGLGISPASTTLAVNNSATFSALGGSSPFTFSVFSGGGLVNASTGVYTAGGAAGTAMVRVTDSLGATANATVTVNAALAISPASLSLAVNNPFTFSSSGGVSPYTYSVFSGGGSINSSTGVYTAPATAGSATIRVTDGLGNISNSTVTINAALAISPASQIVLANSTITFSSSGGVSPYTYSVLSGGGSINSSSGAYTAPGTNGSAVVRVSDTLGNTADSNVTVTTILGITPATKTLAVNNAFTFSATGGTSPFTFSIFSGGGTVNSATGIFTAGATSGSTSLRVTDSLGATANATITVNPALAITPSTATIASTGTQSFSSSGGVSPYTYSINSGPGSINSSTGLYTAASAGTVVVRVTDSLTNTSDAALTVNGPLTVSPVTAYVVAGSDLALTPSGGVSPYSFSIVVGAGMIDTVTGVYSAAATTGSATLRTTDATAATADTAVTIYNPLILSPLTITMSINGTTTFTASGGVGALTFSVSSGAGTINSTTGVYTAPAIAGSDIVQVTDTIGNVVAANITVVSQLTITPSTLKLPVFSTMTFTSVLGSSPYVYSVFAGTGTINSSTGLYTAPSVVGTGTARVTDSISNFSDALVTHIEPVEIKSGDSHTCVRYNEGSVKCFGDGAFGQLGNGSTTDLGDAATEQGGKLTFVNLGTGRTATALATGASHSCALLDNATVKCWGQNTYGQLGNGSTTSRGDGANEMGDSLPAANIGVGRTVSKVFAFGYVTCVILDNNATKCFGRNSTGQLGQGDITNRGTSAVQMGDSLLAINLGASRFATKLSGGLDFTCALLDNATVKCFGNSRYGQLGYDNSLTLGDGAGEMAALAAVNVGAGRTVVDIGMGYNHSCVVLDNGTAKCWGRNNTAQLGLGSNVNQYGTSAGDMAALPAIAFTSFTPTKIWSGRQFSCAMNATGGTRCWGLATSGQLMTGGTAAQGDGNGEMAGLANINFGTAVVPSSVSLGSYMGCVLTTNKRLKCFGAALNGALLNASTVINLGDTAGELGDGLPWVNH